MENSNEKVNSFRKPLRSRNYYAVYKPIGAQLIIWGEDLINNFAGIADFCMKIGYSYLEAPAMILEISAPVVREVITQRQIPLHAIHVGYPNVSTPDELDKTIDYVNTIGAHVLISSGISETISVQAYEDTADVLNSIGDRCQQKGIQFYYHTHWWEYIPDEMGVRGIDKLLANTHPGIVKFNLDICWAASGGLDPVAAVRLLADRCDYYHVKDGIMTESPASVLWRPLGKGSVNIGAFVRELSGENKESRIVVEQDEPHRTAELDMEANLKYMRDLFR